VIYFSTQPRNHIVEAHLADGGWCVRVEDRMIVLRADGHRTDLIDLEALPFTLGGRIDFQVQNALAAVAAGWGAGLNPALIARALTTFTTDSATVPGRFNIMEFNGVEVIVDYAHNTSAMVALGQAVQALGERRTIVALHLPGDRRDEDLLATIDATTSWTDEYILFDMEDRRGRAVNEVPELMAAYLPPDKPWRIYADQRRGVSAAWASARPGDRVMLLIDDVDDGLLLLDQLTGVGADSVLCEAPITARDGRAGRFDAATSRQSSRIASHRRWR
jgi:cyanophycin synthetase